jgi:hypothetical protein
MKFATFVVRDTFRKGVGTGCAVGGIGNRAECGVSSTMDPGAPSKV